MKTAEREIRERGDRRGERGEQMKEEEGHWRRVMEEKRKECVLSGEGVEKSDLFTSEVSRSLPPLSHAFSNTHTHTRASETVSSVLWQQFK